MNIPPVPVPVPTHDSDWRPDDAALTEPLLQVPEGFADRVMAALPARAAHTARQRSTPSRWRLVQAAVLALGGALGLAEALFFVFGLWASTAVALG